MLYQIHSMHHSNQWRNVFNLPACSGTSALRMPYCDEGVRIEASNSNVSHRKYLPTVAIGLYTFQWAPAQNGDSPVCVAIKCCKRPEDWPITQWIRLGTCRCKKDALITPWNSGSGNRMASFLYKQQRRRRPSSRTEFIREPWAANANSFTLSRAEGATFSIDRKAVLAVVRYFPGSAEQFMEQMQDAATRVGLQSHFVTNNSGRNIQWRTGCGQKTATVMFCKMTGTISVQGPTRDIPKIASLLMSWTMPPKPRPVNTNKTVAVPQPDQVSQSLYQDLSNISSDSSIQVALQDEALDYDSSELPWSGMQQQNYGWPCTSTYGMLLPYNCSYLPAQWMPPSELVCGIPVTMDVTMPIPPQYEMQPVPFQMGTPKASTLGFIAPGGIVDFDCGQLTANYDTGQFTSGAGPPLMFWPTDEPLEDDGLSNIRCDTPSPRSRLLPTLFTDSSTLVHTITS